MNIKNLFGLPISSGHFLISKDKALDKKSGFIVDANKVVDKPLANQESASEIKREIEVVESVSESKIELSLASNEENIEVKDGFLIEVFESGSDGKLTRVYSKDVVDPFSGDVIREGFLNYLILEVDK